MAETVDVFQDGEHPPAVPVPAGRRRLAGRIASVLSAPDGPGALVVGGPGTGKTCLARQVLERMGPGVHSERVRGSTLVSAIPYGALHYLLSDVDERVLEHPIHVVAAVGRLLRERAGGRKTVVFADNAQFVDEQAAVTLAQLAADGTISLLLCAEDVARIPASFAGLWRNGLLRRFDAAGFTCPETADWLAAVLGAPACGQAVHELQAASGGNPMLLGVLASEWARSGRLAEQDGRWVLIPRRNRPGNGLDGYLPASLAGLAPGQQTMAEILAMLGSLPMDLLRTAGSGDAFDEDFDELHGRGIVMLEAGPAPAARIPDRLLAEVLRRGLRPERSRQLLGMVLDAGAWEALTLAGSNGAMLSLARWALDSGTGLEPSQALAAAQAALDLADPALALQLAQQVPGHPASAVVQAEAHLALHDPPGAAAVLAAAGEAGLPAAADGPEADGRWLQAVLVRSRAARTQPESTGRAARLLTAAAQKLAGTTAAGSVAARQLDLEQADLALFEGRFHDISPEVLHACLHGPEPRLRDRSAVLLLQVQAATGREADAQRLGRELAESCGPDGSGVAAGLRERFRRQGMWDACARLLDPRSGRAALRDGRIWIQAEIAEGLRLAEAGEPRRALERLQPALGRLQDPAGRQLLPLAASACAYAFALLEHRDSVREHLDLAGEGGPDLPWQTGAAARYYAGMARATVTSYSSAAAGLHEDGRRAEDRGALAAALRCLSGAVRLGRVGAAPDLVRVAARVQGRFAQACAAFGSGLQAQEPPALLAAAGLAAGTGNTVFSREAARLALALAAGGDTTLMRLALKYVFPDAAGFDFCVGRLGGDRSLTAREQEVAARVAAGQSNADIARHFGVSVRTVEGHLYKLYARLQPRHGPVRAGVAGEKAGERG